MEQAYATLSEKLDDIISRFKLDEILNSRPGQITPKHVSGLSVMSSDYSAPLNQLASISITSYNDRKCLKISIFNSHDVELHKSVEHTLHQESNRNSSMERVDRTNEKGVYLVIFKGLISQEYIANHLKSIIKPRIEKYKLSARSERQKYQKSISHLIKTSKEEHSSWMKKCDKVMSKFTSQMDDLSKKIIKSYGQ